MLLSARTWLFAVLVTTSAIAALPPGQASAAGVARNMITGERTSQPIGHAEFCTRHGGECRISSSQPLSPIQMTDGVRKLLVSINTEVNGSIQAKSDLMLYGKTEVWTYPDKGFGDCEDFALLKRKKLNAAGFPLANLLITVVRKHDGEGHAVLTVHTTEGDLVLDNLSSKVKHWARTGYRFMKRQSRTYTGHWVAVLDNSDVLVGSVD